MARNCMQQQGAFLIIAMILLVVVSGLGVSTLSLSVLNRQASNNFGNHQEAVMRADSMVEHARAKILALDTSVTPNLCNKSEGCLLWESGQIPSAIHHTSNGGQNLSWWSNYGTSFDGGSFANNSNMYYIIESTSVVNTVSGYTYGFRIIGHATDNTGTVVATSEGYQEIDVAVAVTSSFEYDDNLPSWIDLEATGGSLTEGCYQLNGEYCGWGVSGQVTTNPIISDEIDYNHQTGEQQKLTFASEKPIQEVSFEFGFFSAEEGGGERAEVRFYAEDGSFLGSEIITANDPDRVVSPASGDSFFSFEIMPISYTTTNSNEESGSDSSDFLLNAVNMTYVE